METIWVEVVLVFVAIVANGFFSASEISLVSSRTSRLVQLQAQGVQGAGRALALKQTPDRFLATIQIAITLVGTLASAVGGATAVEALTPVLVSLGAGAWAGALALVLVIVAITYVSLVIGELVPKAIAMRDPERVASFAAGIVAWLSRVAGGVVSFLAVSTRTVLRVLGLRDFGAAVPVSEEEVRYLLREGAAAGIFERLETELVHKVFDFTDTRVSAIMTPRPDVLGLDVETPPEAVLAAAAEIGHSGIPVYRRSIDDPVGVVTLKDIMRAVARGEPPVLTVLAHPPLFVPETAPVTVLLRELQRSRQRLALIVDEYGAVVGIATIEDVVEEIVGEIREEHEPVTGVLTRLSDGNYVTDGDAPIRDVSAALGLAPPDAGGYQTIAGLILHTLGRIPTPGTAVSLGGYRWTVLEMEGPRITRVRIERERGAAAPALAPPAPLPPAAS
jgi:putative hemolysin